MMKKLLLIFISVLMLNSVTRGQLAERQAGLRMGYTSGFFFQKGIEAGNAEIAYNAMLTFRKGGIQVTGLKIIYETALSDISPDLYLGWGYGGHAGFIYSDHIRSMGGDYYFRGDRFCPLIGVDGWLSAEYRIREIPVNISLNFKPFIELTVPSFFRVVPGDFALSISYIF